jgi:hypothetical protein
VRAHLREAPDGPVPVIHRGRHAVYLDVGGRCVGVVGRRATAVPCALGLRTDDLGRLRGERADLRRGVLHVDGTPLEIGRIVDVRVPPLPPAAGSVTAAAVPPAGMTELVGPVPARLGHDDVVRIVGRGDGLTPLGDDVLCGWLALHRAAGVATAEVDAAVRSCLDRTTLLSATLLDCALHGEVIPEFAAYVAALADPDTTGDRADRLASVGHTSGSGMLYGAHLALSALPHSGVAA